jgi:general secretion pathway protein E
MKVDNPIKRQIVQSPDAVVLRQIALQRGMTSLIKHGAVLVREGISTVTEVLRVCRGSEEQE